MTISKFANDMLEKIINQVRKEENMKKIEQNLVDPLIKYTFKKLFPYILISGIVFLLTFLLALLILLLLLKQLYKTN